MNQALEEQVEDKIMLMQLKSNFFRTADHLINVDEPGAASLSQDPADPLT